MPPSFQGKCAAVALPLAADTPITKLLVCSCPHSIPCSLGLDQLVPVVILYFHPPTACMPLQTIEQLTFLSLAGPHIWVFRCRMPPPLLRIQGCYSLQPGLRWGTNPISGSTLSTNTRPWACCVSHQSLLGLGLACCSG